MRATTANLLDIHPGSLSLYRDRGEKRILFGQDIHGPFLPIPGSDIETWRRSMIKLVELEADILCEGTLRQLLLDGLPVTLLR